MSDQDDTPVEKPEKKKMSFLMRMAVYSIVITLVSYMASAVFIK